MKNKGFKLIAFLMLMFSGMFFAESALATGIPNVSLTVDGASSPSEVTSSIQILFVITIIALAPSILILMTSFTRFIIVFYFLRSALGTQQTPPNQVLVGLALFMTLFLMMPVFNKVNENAWQPYKAGQLTIEDAMIKAGEPMKEFMANQAYEKDIALFMDLSEYEIVEDVKDVPMSVVIPAFIISELKKGFMIGFIIYVPFIVIDMVVSSVLMAMGMMMLPPTTISLPFKILLFIMVDGWNLIVGELIKSFRM